MIDLGLIIAVLLTRAMAISRYLHQWDSVQFALGLSNYDIMRHQPHPPGYPGYIGLAWIIRHVVSDDNLALVIVGIISAVIIAVALHHIGRMMISPRAGIFAGILGALNPLLWYFSDIALSYIAGTAFATLAVWAAIALKGRGNLWIPFLAGLSCIFWLPAGIIILPVCLYIYLSDPERSEPLTLRIAGFVGLFVLPIFVAFMPVIARTGGMGAYLATIGSESGKHVSQLSQWMQAPLDELIKNTGSIAAFFKEGFGMGRWLLLILLIPMPGETGVRPNRVVGLLPLFVAGFVTLHWGNNSIIRAAGIIAATVSVMYLLPVPATPDARERRNILVCWLLPGLLLFVPVYANYVGILLIFVPGIILMEAWAVDRAGVFMGLQTIREPATVVKSGEKVEVPAKAPDVRVERLVVWLLIFFMAMHEVGVFTAGKTTSQESWNGIIARDSYVESVITAFHKSQIPLNEVLVLGGEDDYRHWTYYLPEARSIWTKYLLYSPFRPGTGIWVSQGRHQDQVVPEVEGTSGAAVMPLWGEKAVFVLPGEFKRFSGNNVVTPLGATAQGTEPIAYLVDVDGATRVAFREGTWWLE